MQGSSFGLSRLFPFRSFKRVRPQPPLTPRVGGGPFACLANASCFFCFTRAGPDRKGKFTHRYRPELSGRGPLRSMNFRDWLVDSCTLRRPLPSNSLMTAPCYRGRSGCPSLGLASSKKVAASGAQPHQSPTGANRGIAPRNSAPYLRIILRFPSQRTRRDGRKGDKGLHPGTSRPSTYDQPAFDQRIAKGKPRSPLPDSFRRWNRTLPYPSHARAVARLGDAPGQQRGPIAPGMPPSSATSTKNQRIIGHGRNGKQVTWQKPRRSVAPAYGADRHAGFDLRATPS